MNDPMVIDPAVIVAEVATDLMEVDDSAFVSDWFLSQCSGIGKAGFIVDTPLRRFLALHSQTRDRNTKKDFMLNTETDPLEGGPSMVKAFSTPELKVAA